MSRSTITPADAAAVNAVLIAVRQAANVLCDRWSLALIFAAFLGDRRFSALSKRTGMASRLLTARLRTLVTDQIMVRVPYSRHPPRHEYWFTNMGLDLFEVIIQMIRWEQRWRPDSGDLLLNLSHSGCGDPLRPELRCRSCRNCLTAREIDLRVSSTLMAKMPGKETPYRRSTVDRETEDAPSSMLGLTLDIFGDKWSIEIIICAFLRIRRFTDFRSHTGISANILSDRLGRLIKAGLLVDASAVDPTKEPGYRLTEMGIDIYGVLVAIQDWADAWLNDRVRSPVRLIHSRCGEIFHPVTTCATCGEVVGPSAVRFPTGPVTNDQNRAVLAPVN